MVSQMEMDALYSKLWNKYSTIKTEKFSELEQQNENQGDKFKKYINVAEDYMEHVETENENFRSQLDDLRSEIAALRSAKYEQFSEYQKLYMEENRKNRELSEEVTKLQKMLQAETLNRMKGSNADNEELCMSGGGGEVSGEAGNTSKRRDINKRKRRSESETGDINMPSRSHDESLTPSESAKGVHKEAVPREFFVISHKTKVNSQPQCCRNLEESGGSVAVTSNCLFQELIEYALGLKFSVVHQTEEACISAGHQSSGNMTCIDFEVGGLKHIALAKLLYPDKHYNYILIDSGYSFTLTWVNSASEEKPELHYRCVSLGTFERVAPEWMSDELMFSTTMCPIFFERVSRVVKMF